jgi:hypothetical protein
LSAADAEHEAFERFGAPEIVAAHILEERDRMKTGIAVRLAPSGSVNGGVLVPTVLAAVVTASRRTTSSLCAISRPTSSSSSLSVCRRVTSARR